ncbi:hypothetical protein B0H14DRAFT_3424016 [Mycena olivaceomarginata]|nr:hypothetical protein B0H14DRAFT_3424016 [Mycena olivaceomarginata]
MPGFLSASIDSSTYFHVRPPTNTLLRRYRRNRVQTLTSKTSVGVSRAANLRLVTENGIARPCWRTAGSVPAQARMEARIRRHGRPPSKAARTKSRESSARYREKNREALALKQRNARKALFIAKHGCRAWLSRSWKKSGALQRYANSLAEKMRQVKSPAAPAI